MNFDRTSTQYFPPKKNSAIRNHNKPYNLPKLIEFFLFVATELDNDFFSWCIQPKFSIKIDVVKKWNKERKKNEKRNLE